MAEELSPGAIRVMKLVAQRRPSRSELDLARSRLQQRTRRQAAKQYVQDEKDMDDAYDEMLAEFKKSGFSTMLEFEAHLGVLSDAKDRAAAESTARVAAFLGAARARAGSLPSPDDMVDVALELSLRHDGGPAVRLVSLLVEAGLATTVEDAAPLCWSPIGKALTSALTSMLWTRRRANGGNRRWVWLPPATGGRDGQGRDGLKLP